MQNELAMSDEELVTRAQAGDQDAFSQLVSRYFHMVYVVSYGYLKNHEAAEDLAQETFIRALAGLSSLKNGKCLPAWLNQVTRNHALNWLKNGSTKSRVITMIPLDSYDEKHDPAAPSARDNAAASEQQKLIEAAVLNLPEHLRSVVLLHYSAGFSKSDIARRLGVHPSSIGRNLDKAHGILRKELDSDTVQPKLDLPRKSESVTRTILLATAFAGLSSGSQAGLLQGSNSLTPVPASGLISKLQYTYGAMPAAGWLACAVAVAGLFTLGAVSAQLEKPSAQSRIASVSPHNIRNVSRKQFRTSAKAGRLKKANVKTTGVLTVEPVFQTKVYGRVSRPDGEPAAGAVMKLLTVRDEKADRVVAETRADANGNYQMIVSESPAAVAKEARSETRTTQYYLRINSPGFVSSERLIYRRPRSETALNPTLENIDLTALEVTDMKGFVTNEASEPIPGARLSVLHFLDKSEPVDTVEDVLSDESGAFGFSSITSGTNRIRVDADGYAAWVGYINAPKDDVQIKLLQHGFSVCGNLLSEETSAPIAGAEIALSSYHLPADLNAISDSSGFFNFSQLPKGKYVLKLGRTENLFLVPRSVPASNMITEMGPYPEMIPLELGRNPETTLTLAVYPGHTISGRVTDKSTGRPLANATVYAGANDPVTSAVTNNDGYFEMPHVPVASQNTNGNSAPGFYLCASKNGYAIATNENDQPGAIINLTNAQRNVTQNLEMLPTTTVSGVIQSPDGQPVSGAIVTRMTRFVTPHNRVITDEQGRYEIEVESQKLTRFRADATGFTMGYMAENIKDMPVSNLNFSLTKPAAFSGRVIDDNGNPIPGARISASTVLWSDNVPSGMPIGLTALESDDDGNFALDNVPPFEIGIEASKKGYSPSKNETIRLNPGERKDNIILVQTQGTLAAGEVRDRAGNPLADIRVLAQGSSAVTGADGRFKLDDVQGAIKQLSLMQTKPTYFTDQVDVSNMDLTHLNIVFDTEGVTFRGRLVDYLTSAPVSGATVTGAGTTALMNDEKPGEFTVSGLMRGTVPKIEIRVTGYLDETVQIAPKPGDKILEQTIVLGPGGTISGRVLNEDGAAASDTEVVLNDTLPVPKTLQITHTDSDGHFKFQSVVPGKIIVRVNPKKPFIPSLETLTISHGDSVNIPENHFTRGSTLIVTLRDDSTGSPVAGNVIELRDNISGRQSQRTDNAGQVRFDGVVANSVFVISPDFHIWALLNLARQPVREITFNTGNASLIGTFTKAGKPILGDITLRLKDYYAKSKTDENGQVIVKKLLPGHWDVEVVYYENRQEKTWKSTIELPGGALCKTFEIQ